MFLVSFVLVKLHAISRGNKKFRVQFKTRKEKRKLQVVTSFIAGKLFYYLQVTYPQFIQNQLCFGVELFLQTHIVFFQCFFLIFFDVFCNTHNGSIKNSDVGIVIVDLDHEMYTFGVDQMIKWVGSQDGTFPLVIAFGEEDRGGNK